MQQTSSQRGSAMPIVLLVVLLILVAGGIYFYLQRPAPASNVNQETTNVPLNDTVEANTNEPTEDMIATSTMMDDGQNATSSVEENIDTQTAKTFAVAGTNFAFDTKEIRVKKGDVVTINFTSKDGFHDWVVDEFNAHTARVSTGGSTSVTFTASKSGTFEYYCSVGSHRQMGMVGKLIVE